MSSGCDSQKSVVINGCVSAEPSPTGCAAWDRLPFGRTRKLSFSIPRASRPSRCLPRLAASASILRSSCDVIATHSHPSPGGGRVTPSGGSCLEGCRRSGGDDFRVDGEAFEVLDELGDEPFGSLVVGRLV